MPASGAEIVDDVAVRSVLHPLAEQEHHRHDRTVLPRSRPAVPLWPDRREDAAAGSPTDESGRPSNSLLRCAMEEQPNRRRMEGRTERPGDSFVRLRQSDVVSRQFELKSVRVLKVDRVRNAVILKLKTDAPAPELLLSSLEVVPVDPEGDVP